jgi:hypothetical protein
MHQTTFESVELSESMPEIKLTVPVTKVSDIGVDELVKVIKNEEVGAALQVLMSYLADAVATRIMERMGQVSTLSARPQATVIPIQRVTATEVAPRKRKQLSEEARKRISESQKKRWENRPRTLSDEAKAKISASQKSRWAIRNGGEHVSASPSEASTSTEADRQSPHNNPVDEAVTAVEIPEATLAVADGYKGDQFYIAADGHFIGDDGFVVPQDFTEFTQRFPKYIDSWVRRRLGGQGIEEDIEDWRQELIIHLKYLPPTSKHRGLGKEDVVQTFNPFAQYGASERRWRHYINNCLANKFNTIHGKKIKNPVCRPGNLTVASMTSPDHTGEVSDEYVYSKSEYLSNATDREEKNKNDMSFAKRFFDYVQVVEPEVFPILEAVYIAGSSTDTVKEFCKTCSRLATTKERAEGLHTDHEIGLSQKEFNRARNRLKALGVAFLKNDNSNPAD